MFLFTTIFLLSGVVLNVHSYGSSLPYASESELTFSQKLYQALRSEVLVASENGNLVSSPLSSYIALSMLAFGADEQAKNDFAHTLGLPKDFKSAKYELRNLISALENVENVTVNVANQILISKDLKLKSDYQKLISEVFNGKVSNVDFSNMKGVVQLANKWSAEKTNNMIPTILTEDGISPSLEMILLNAVYFKGTWKTPFPADQTTERTFYLAGRTSQRVPTMFQEGLFTFADSAELNATLIILPYANERMQMVIVHPWEVDGLARAEEEIDSLNINEFIRKNANAQKIRLSMPKFKIQSSFQLVPVLEKLGLGSALASGFSGMTGSPVQISKIFQKAVIEVNEEGSQAAAVTEVEFERIGSMALSVNSPFYFMIQYDGSTLFQGRVVDPTLQ